MENYTLKKFIKHVLLTGRKDAAGEDIPKQSIHSHNKSYKEEMEVKNTT